MEWDSDLRSIKLNDLLLKDLFDIADSVSSSPISWSRIGLCFEQTHGFVYTKRMLMAMNCPGCADNELCETLFELLSERDVSCYELAMHLTTNGLNAIANKIWQMARERKDNPKKNSTKNSTKPIEANNIVAHQSQPLPVINKYIIVVHDSDELCRRVDQAVIAHGFKADMTHEDFLLSYHSGTIGYDSYLMKMAPQDIGQVQTIQSFLPLASTILFISMHGQESIASIDATKLAPRTKIYFEHLLQRTQQLNKHHLCFTLSQNELELAYNESFFKWMLDADQRSGGLACIRCKIVHKSKSVEQVQMTANQILTKICRCNRHVKPAGVSQGCVAVYFMVPTIFLAAIAMNKVHIFDAFKKEGLTLMSIEQVAVRNVIEAIWQPENEFYYDKLYEVISDMVDNNIPLSLNDRFCLKLVEPSLQDKVGQGFLIHFQYTCETTVGQSVHVIGNTPELGNWTPTPYNALVKMDAMLWEKQLYIVIPETAIEYKFVIVQNGVAMKMEPGRNRELTIQTLDIPTLSNTNEAKVTSSEQTGHAIATLDANQDSSKKQTLHSPEEERCESELMSGSQSPASNSHVSGELSSNEPAGTLILLRTMMFTMMMQNHLIRWNGIDV